MIQPNIKTYQRVVAQYVPMPIRKKLVKCSRPKPVLKDLNSYGRNHLNYVQKDNAYSRDLILTKIK